MLTGVHPALASAITRDERILTPAPALWTTRPASQRVRRLPMIDEPLRSVMTVNVSKGDHPEDRVLSRPGRRRCRWYR